MTSSLLPLIQSWPVMMAPHFDHRSVERDFQEAWIPHFWSGSWSPDPHHCTRFVVEAEIARGDWWRLIVDLSPEAEVVVLITVYPIAATQVAA